MAMPVTRNDYLTKGHCKARHCTMLDIEDFGIDNILTMCFFADGNSGDADLQTRRMSS